MPSPPPRRTAAHSPELSAGISETPTERMLDWLVPPEEAGAVLDPAAVASRELLRAAWGIGRTGSAANPAAVAAEIAAAFEEDPFADPLGTQLRGGEAAVAFAIRHPDRKDARGLLRDGVALLRTIAEEMFDEDGIPQAGIWEEWPLFVASWTRLGLLKPTLSAAATKAWDETFELADRSRQRYAIGPLVRQPARVIRCWKTQIRPRWEPRFPSQPPRPTDAADGTFHSEWAEAAVLTAADPPDAPRLEVLHHAPRLELRLRSDRRDWLVGPADCCVRTADAGPLEELRPSEWTCVCWEADGDAVYIELEGALPYGMRLQRQLLLAREDRLFFAADALLETAKACADRPRRLVSHWPIPPGTHVSDRQPHPEMVVESAGVGVRVLPVTLGEWSRDTSRGTFVARPDAAGGTLLESSTPLRGNATFAALVWDLDRRRISEEPAWRHLTVAEDRKIIPPDVAVAGRFQFARSHWLYYRSLGPAGIRTFFGKHLTEQFLFARLDRRGLLRTLMAIE